VSHNPLNVLGTANGATYDFGGNTDVPVVSIDFDNFIISAPANGVVTLKQGYTFGGTLTASATAANFNYYVLSNIAANSTLTLPAGVAGNSIKISNLSALNASGVYTMPSFTWTISPNGSEKIMRSTSLVLDASTESFELLYADTNNGWVIN